LFPLSLSVLVPLGLSLYYLCLFISSVFFLHYLSVVLPFFVAFLCSSWLGHKSLCPLYVPVFSPLPIRLCVLWSL
jgi:hypothetical protein